MKLRSRKKRVNAPQIRETNGSNNKLDGGNRNDIYITPGTIYKLSKEWEIGIATPIGTTNTSDDYRVVGYLMWEFELD